VSVAHGSFDAMTEVRFRASSAGRPMSSLNLFAGQKQVAALASDAIAKVTGSPGSGKTSAIKALVIDSVAQGANPERILVLAASRESANSLRDELAVDLQMSTGGPLARTLTSFAFGVLRHKAVSLGHRLPELISGSEQDRILAGLIEQLLVADSSEQDLEALGWPKHINAQVFSLNGFRTELRDLLTVCLEYGLTPEALRELGDKHQKPEWVAASGIFETYLNLVNAPEFESRYDASMLLREAAFWLKSSAAPLEALNLNRIIVDDAQELTPASSQLLFVLAEVSGAGLVLVGDPDSSTLGFRAADPRAMSNLVEKLAEARNSKVQEIVLEPNLGLRSPKISQVMGKVTHQIGTARAGLQRKGLSTVSSELPADSAPDLSVEGLVFTTDHAETAWLSRRLRELHLYEGIAWSEMAVVARSRSNLDQLAIALAHESVPIRTVGSQSPLRDEFGSRMLLRLADVVLHRDSELPIQTDMALELLSSPLCGLDSLGLRRLRRALRREELLADGARNSDELLANLFGAPGAAATIKTQEGKKVDRFLKLFFEAQDIANDPQMSVEDLLWHIWNKSALATPWQTLSRGVGEVAVQANRNLDAVVALFAAANRYAERNPGGDPRVFITQQLSLGLPEDSLALNDQHQATVSLLTPSGLLGRRFKVVALPGLVEGVWPNLRPRSSLLGATNLDALLNGRIEDPNEASRSELPDELRMLYKSVGATDSKLLVSATSTEDNQLSQFLRLILGEVPSPAPFQGSPLTLRAMAGSLRRALATSSNPAQIESAALGLARLASAGVQGAHPDSWYGLLPLSTIEPLVDLADPEAQVKVRPSQLENFIKCPLHWFLNAHGGSDTTFSASLGSLVHSIFETTALNPGDQVDEASMWNLVESKWHTLNFESAWLEQAGERKAKKMIANMAQYLRRFEAEGAQVIGREANFEFTLGQALVRGQVDRLELYPDGRVMIVDLKTGSRGFTAEQAREHSQLAMYQLAFENGAFGDLEGIQGNAEFAPVLAGAKLLLIGGSKIVEREQPSIHDSEADREKFENLVALATKGMAMTDQLFVAQVGSHCTNENEYGSCKIHLVKAVSNAG